MTHKCLLSTRELDEFLKFDNFPKMKRIAYFCPLTELNVNSKAFGLM